MSTSFIEELTLLYKESAPDCPRVLIEQLSDQQKEHLELHGFSISEMAVEGTKIFAIHLTGKWDENSKTVVAREIGDCDARLARLNQAYDNYATERERAEYVMEKIRERRAQLVEKLK